MFGPRTEEVTEGWGNYTYNEELGNWYSSPNGWSNEGGRDVWGM